MRAKVQEVALLLEISFNGFVDRFKQLAKQIKATAIVKAIDSLDDAPPGLKAKLHDAFDAWVDSGGLSNSGYYSEVLFTKLKAALGSLSDDQLDDLFSKITNFEAVPSHADKSIQDIAFNSILKRLSHIPIPILRDLREDLQDLQLNVKNHATARDFLNYALGAVIESNPTEKHFRLQSSKGYFTRWLEQLDSEDAESEIDKLDKIIAGFEAKKAEAAWDVVDAGRELLDLLKEKVPSDLKPYYETVISYDYHIGMSDYNSINTFNAYLNEDENEFLEEYARIAERSSRLARKVITQIKAMLERETPKAARYVQTLKGELTEEQLQDLQTLADYARFTHKLGGAKVSRDYFGKSIWNFPNDFTDKIDKITKIDPEVGPKSMTRLRAVMAYSQIINSSELHEYIKNLRDDLAQVKEQLKAKDDPQFIALIDGLIKLSDTIRSMPDDDIVDTFETLGPEKSSNETYFWGSIISTMRSKGDDFTKQPNDLKRALKAWALTSEGDRPKLLQRAKKIASSWIKKTKAKNAELLKKAPPEAEPSAPLQQWAFADQRKGKVPYEANSKEEQKLYNDLYAHFVNNDPISPAHAKLIQSFLQKGQYASVFREPKQAYVLRGMNVPADYLRKALKLKPGDDLPPKGNKAASFTFTPLSGRGATSWSSTSQGAVKFSNDGGYGSYAIIMVASVKKNPNKFCMGPGALYNVQGFDEYETEDEVIALGEINVSKVFWSINSITKSTPGLPKGGVGHKTLKKKKKVATNKSVAKKPIAKKKPVAAKKLVNKSTKKK